VTDCLSVIDRSLARFLARNHPHLKETIMSLTDTIASPGVAHRAMAAELDLIADLMGGTAAMRRVGQRWLPRENAESWTAWRARLNRTVLFNGFARTVQSLAGRPFATPVRER
jgi:hypothetical protein